MAGANIVLVTFDRMVAVFLPLRYASLITHRTTCVLIGIIWIGSLLFAIPMSTVGSVDGDVITYGHLALIILFGVVICVMHFKVAQVTKEHAKRLSTGSPGHVDKGTRMFIIVLVFTLASWGPVNVVKVLWNLRIISLTFYTKYIEYFVLVAFANSGVNSIIYATLNSKFRKAYCLMLGLKSSNVETINAVSKRNGQAGNTE